MDRSRGYKPGRKVWLISLHENMQQVKFDNVCSTQNATSKGRVSYLDGTNQVAKCHLKFRGFLKKVTVLLMY